jgi:hypothetical protein
MRIWNVLAAVFFISGFVNHAGIGWDFFDQGAKTEWEEQITSLLYYITCFLCLAVDDILEALKDKD